MTPAQIVARIDRADAAYWKEIEAIADVVRNKYVIPYCDRTGLRFTGMGSWSFDGKGKHIGDWDSKGQLPQRLDNLLHTGTVNTRTDLAMMMEDYTPKGWKK